MVMVALRSGRSCLMTLAVDRPLRSWVRCTTARGEHDGQMGFDRVSGAENIGRAARSVLDIRNAFSTCHQVVLIDDHLILGPVSLRCRANIPINLRTS